jgi:uncharacterized protein (AIM24 family)
MATRAVRGEGPSADDFNDLLVRGGELLGSGRVIESKDLLERAVSIDNRDEKALNLLGLAYFKLGMFDRASEIYEGLVRNNPADHTLRVNLGLVYLKSNALQRAIREFEVATDLSPGHAKAHNYLGLALAQVGEYGRARENFIAAGSDAMAEKMARALEEARAASPVAVVPPPPAPPRPAAPMPQPEEVTIEVMDEAHHQLAEADWGTQVPGEVSAAPAPVAAPIEPPAPLEAAAPAPTAEELRFAEDEGPSAPPMDQPIPVAPEKAEEPILLERKLEPPAEPEKPLFKVEPSRPEKEAVEIAPPAVPELAAATFELVGEVLAVRVRDEVLVRTEGLIATSGTVTLTPEPKRFRGRPKDEPFGNGIARLMRAKGQGRVLIERAGRKFVAFDLKDESAYLREEVVFGFEEPIAFENGRLPSDEEPIELVHLRGEGQVLVRLPGALRSVRVRMEQPVTVALSSWVGWHGNVSPRVVALRPAGDGAKGPLAIELTGEGFALLSVPIG